MCLGHIYREKEKKKWGACTPLILSIVRLGQFEGFDADGVCFWLLAKYSEIMTMSSFSRVRPFLVTFTL